MVENIYREICWRLEGMLEAVLTGGFGLMTHGPWHKVAVIRVYSRSTRLAESSAAVRLMTMNSVRGFSCTGDYLKAVSLGPRSLVDHI